MLDGRAKKIIACLKDKLAEETEPSRNMLKTYSDYIKDEATDEDLEKAMDDKNDPNYQKYLKIREKNLHKMNPIPVCKFNE